MKKILAILLSVIMLSTLLCIGVSATAVPGIDEAGVNPTKTIAGPIEIKSAGGTGWDAGEQYVSKTDDEFKQYEKNLTVSFDLKIKDQGEWAQLIMYIDSWDSNPWGGYQIRLEGGDAAYGNSGNAVDGDYAVTLYKGGKPDADWVFKAGTALSAVDTSKDYRVIVQRVIGKANTTLKVWFFEKSAGIPEKATLTYEADNASYGGGSAGVKFASWDRIDASVTDLKLYNYEVAVKTADVTVPKVSEAGPLNIQSAGNASWEDGVAYIPQGQESWYGKNLTVDYKLKVKDLGSWAQLILYLDSWDCNPWGGYQLRVEGGDAASGNSGGVMDTDYALTLYKGNKPNSPDWKYVAGEELPVLDANKTYRMTIQRMVGESNTTLNVYFFEDGAALPATPTLRYTETNENYGPASAGVKFTTWDRVDAVVTDLKVYNAVFEDIIPGYMQTAEPSSSTSATTAANATTAGTPEVPETGAASLVIPALALLAGAAAIAVSSRNKTK